MITSLDTLFDYSQMCQSLRFGKLPHADLLASFLGVSEVDSLPTNLKKVQEMIDSELFNKLNQEKEIDFKSLSIALGFNELFPICYKYRNKMNSKSYWKMVGACYTGGGLSEYKKDKLALIFQEPIADREFLMSNKDLKFFNELPEEFTIYRGCSKVEAKSNNFRISWTLDEKIAEHFAKGTEETLRKKSEVVSKTISKSNAIAYFSNRKEKEILYLG